MDKQTVDFKKLVQDTVKQGGGLWCMEWCDKTKSTPPLFVTEYEWFVNQYHISVLFGYLPSEMAACPKNDYSGLPVDWMHVVEYLVTTPNDKLLAHEIVNQ